MVCLLYTICLHGIMVGFIALAIFTPMGTMMEVMGVMRFSRVGMSLSLHREILMN